MLKFSLYYFRFQDSFGSKSEGFKEAVYNYFLKNYGGSAKNIAIDIQNDIITIEWSPQEKDESFDAEFQRSMRLLTDGKLEDARFIMEDLAFRSPECAVHSGHGLQRVP